MKAVILNLETIIEKLINQKWLNNIENSSKEFIFSLKKQNDYRFNPAKKNLTYYNTFIII